MLVAPHDLGPCGSVRLAAYVGKAACGILWQAMSSPNKARNSVQFKSSVEIFESCDDDNRPVPSERSIINSNGVPSEHSISSSHGRVPNLQTAVGINTSCSDKSAFTVQPQVSDAPSRLDSTNSDPSSVGASKTQASNHSSKRGLTFPDVDRLKALEFVIQGAYLTKSCRHSRGRRVTRRYSIDSDCRYLHWEPSRKRMGRRNRIWLTEVYDVYPKPLNCTCKNLAEDECTFEMVTKTRTARLTAASVEELKLWVTALQHRLIQHELEDAEQASFKTIKHIFDEADLDNNGRIGIAEVKDLFLTVGKGVPASYLKKIVRSFDKDGNGELDQSEFNKLWLDTVVKKGLRAYFKDAMERSDEGELGATGSGMKHFQTGAPLLSWEALRHFLVAVQGADEDLKVEDVKGDFQKRFDDRLMKPSTRGITEVGFSMFLCSKGNIILDPQKIRVPQDMSRPLSHYWISTSHNTYLEGAQVAGKASVQQYIKILRQGCRCVEIDCWDGPRGEPVVTHGYALTNKISFQEVVQACKDHGFTQSKFPLILSLEMHCSNAGKCRIAEILTDTLGDMMLRHPAAGHRHGRLISPKEGRHKVLVKSKMVTQDIEESSGSDDDNLMNAQGVRMKVGLAEDGTRLFYCGKVHSKNSGKAFLFQHAANKVTNNVTNAVGGAVAEIGHLFAEQKSENLDVAAEDSVQSTEHFQPEIDKERRCSPVLGMQCEHCEHSQRQLKMAAMYFDKNKRKSAQSAEQKSSRSSFRSSLNSDMEAESTVMDRDSLLETPADRDSTIETPAELLETPAELMTPMTPSGSQRKKRKSRVSRISTRVFKRISPARSSLKLDKDIGKGLAEYNRCIYLVGKGMHSHLERDRHPCEIASLKDAKSLKFMRAHGHDYNHHHRRNLSRIYPPGSNVRSQNVKPMDHWVHGCQMVAMNYQITDIGTILNQALFKYNNGGCGYVLKPSCVLLAEDEEEIQACVEPDPKPLRVWLRVISAHSLPKPLNSSKGDVIDPWVSVKVHGLARDQAEFRTATIQDNGFDPQWDHVFEFKVHQPAVAIISFEVFDEDLMSSKLVSAAAFPVKMLRPGVRWVPLWDSRLKSLPHAGMLVHIHLSAADAPAGLPPPPPSRAETQVAKKISDETAVFDPSNPSSTLDESGLISGVSTRSVDIITSETFLSDILEEPSDDEGASQKFNESREPYARGPTKMELYAGARLPQRCTEQPEAIVISDRYSL